MAERKTVSALILGGEASGGPPLGPALGPMGVNVMSIVNSINEKTKEYSGMRVPVKIHVDTETKQFEIEIGVPTTSALVAKEAKIPKGSGSPKSTFAGDLSIEQAVKIARAKMTQSYATNLRSAVKEVIGSCVSMGVTVEGMDPRQAQKELEGGRWEKLLASE